MPAETSTDTIVEITPTALDQILELRNAEAIPDLYLGLRISGASPSGFTYETAFLRSDDVDGDDHIEHHRDLPVAIPQDSVDNLRGAVLDLSSDPLAPGLVLRNPNTPSPGITDPEMPPLELEGTLEEKVALLLDRRINPAIAMHGGVARLASVDGTVVRLELGGGCQGCGLAAVTLRQGIEAAIFEAIPEVTDVVDVTDHALGENPFYV